MKLPIARSFLGFVVLVMLGQAAHGQQRPPSPGGPACCPRTGCADDYVRKPFPRQSLSYPSFYQCVPAGDCAATTCDASPKRLTWWFLPTPRGLKEALGWSP